MMNERWWVYKGLDAAYGATYRGIPILELTRDEAIAALALALKEIESNRIEHQRQRDFMEELRDGAKR